MPTTTTARPRVSRRKRAFLNALPQITEGIKSRCLAEMYTEACRRMVEDDDPLLFEFMSSLERTPVDIEEFLTSPEFLGATDLTIWPEVRQAIIDINRNWWRGVDYGAYMEALMMGATGTAKSTIAMVSTIYHTYLLSCIQNPQSIYGLPSSTAIVFPIMGAKPHVVNKVVYAPMRKLLEKMPYFQKHMMPDKLIDSEMYFEKKNIRIVKAGGDEDAILGEAVIGGIIDEINFMAVVARSKKAEVSTGRAGLYDQAQQVHHRMYTRKQGRFQRPGSFPMIGLVFPSSSTRYKGDFTDKRKAFIERNKITSTYVYNRRQFDVVPQERFSGKMFKLIIGNNVYHDTRPLREGEQPPPGAWIEEVPIEYLDAFKDKPYDTLRDVLGISNNALSPFIKQRFKVMECVEQAKEMGLQSFLVKDHVILGIDGMPMVKQGFYCTNPSRPRYVHIDLSRNEDRCGIAMIRFEGMTEVIRKVDGAEVVERLPVAVVEMACTIAPDTATEIDIAEVRAFVRHLKERYGFPIKSVTYDGFDSRESIQAWRKSGMKSRMVSVDRSSVPYKNLRNAFNDGRILMVEDEVILEELFDLEYDEDQDKVDHPVHGTKDGIDAVCAAYSEMLERRSTWTAAADDDMDFELAGRASFDERFDEPRPI